MQLDDSDSSSEKSLQFDNDDSSSKNDYEFKENQAPNKKYALMKNPEEKQVSEPKTQELGSFPYLSGPLNIYQQGEEDD